VNLSTMVVSIVQSSVLLCIALIACQCLRSSPEARLTICRVTLVAAVIILLGSPWTHSRNRPVVSVDVASWGLNGPVDSADDHISTHPIRQFRQVRRSQSAPTPIKPKPIDAFVLFQTAWLGGVLLLSAYLIVGFRRLAAVRRRSQPLLSGDIVDVVSNVSAEYGVPAPCVRVGVNIASPFVAGVWRSTLFVPSDWFYGTKDDMHEAIYRHEIAHLAARDLQWNFAQRIVAIVFWPQPLFWALMRQAHIASEQVCDRNVVNSGCSPEQYASALLRLRDRLGKASTAYPLGIGAVSIRSVFGRRIEAIMKNSGGKNSSPSRFSLSALSLVCGLVAVSAATIIAAPNWREHPSASRSRQGTAKMSGHAIVQILTLDGKPATGTVGVVFDGRSQAKEWIETPVRDGKIDIDLGLHAGYPRATLVAIAPGYGIAFKILWPTEKSVYELRLNPATRLVGQILLPNGKPAANLHVVPRMLADPPNGPGAAFLMPPKDLQSLLMSATDSDGRFQMSGLAQGTQIRFEILEPEYATIANYEKRIKLATGPISTCDSTRLSPAAYFEGRVTRNGSPVVGLRIGAQANMNLDRDPGLEGGAVTDADGKYRMAKLRPGIYNLIADLQDTWDAEVTAVAHEGVTIQEGETKTGLDFELIPGGFVSGKVTKSDGSPVEGIGVGIYGPAHPNSSAWVQTAFTDPKGVYRLRVPAGEQFVYLYTTPTAPGDQADQQQHTVTVQDRETTTVNFSWK